MKTRKPMTVRFWTKVKKLDDVKCWEWMAAKNNKGYGVIGRPGYRAGLLLVHRYSYEIHIGPIPDGKLVCHSCDNRICVNPNHLFLGTSKDNSQDMAQKGRHFTVASPEKIRRGFKANPNSIHRGSDHTMSKLTESDVIKIRSSDKTQRSLAALFGVNPATIRRVKLRRSWAHVA